MNKKLLFNIFLVLEAIFLLSKEAEAQHSHGSSCSREEHEDEHDHEHGEEEEELQGYNLGLSIGSIFVIMAVSFMGAAFPLLLRVKNHPWIVLSIKIGTYAGSGVILATAFAHMLFAANLSLTSDCLSEGWLSKYEPWAFMFTVVTIVVLQTMDYILFLFLRVGPEIHRREPGKSSANNSSNPEHSITECGQDHLMGITGPQGTCADGVIHDAPSWHAVGRRDELASVEWGEGNGHDTFKDGTCKSRALLPGTDALATSRRLSNIIVSEVSIGMHSIIIGIALGISSSDEFVPLFIALVFHQSLEGVALGSNATESGMTPAVVLLLAAIYSFTTPLGIAIGIGVRESLDTSSPEYLYITGILDCIAAGALIFLALGDHMKAPRSQAAWLKTQPALIQVTCFASFYAGAAALLVLAIWA